MILRLNLNGEELIANNKERVFEMIMARKNQKVSIAKFALTGEPMNFQRYKQNTILKQALRKIQDSNLKNKMTTSNDQ